MLLIQPLALAIDLEAGAVDQEMQRLAGVDPLRQNRQATAAAAQGRVIRDSDSVSCDPG